MSNNLNRGILLAFLTAAVSGFSNFFNKFAVSAISPPLVFTAVKNVGVGLLIISSLLISRKWSKLSLLTKKQLSYLILIGIVGGSLPFYLYFTGLSQTPVVNAVLIRSSLVFWVGLLAIPFLREKLSRLQIIAAIFFLVANFPLGGFTGFKFSLPELFILLSTILWAVETVLAKKVLPGIDPDLLVGFRMGFGSLILITAAFITTPAPLANIFNLSYIQWLWLALTISTLFFYVTFWYRALKLAPAITVTAILSSASLVTNLLSAVFITHKFTYDILWQAGLFSIAISLVLLTAGLLPKLLLSKIKGFFLPVV